MSVESIAYRTDLLFPGFDGEVLDGKSDAYAGFKLALRARYRGMIEGCLGVWLGAFVDDELIGSLGLFANVDTTAHRIYERLGFTEIERQCGVFRAPAGD